MPISLPPPTTPTLSVTVGLSGAGFAPGSAAAGAGGLAGWEAGGAVLACGAADGAGPTGGVGDAAGAQAPAQSIASSRQQTIRGCRATASTWNIVPSSAPRLARAGPKARRSTTRAPLWAPPRGSPGIAHPSHHHAILRLGDQQSVQALTRNAALARVGPRPYGAERSMASPCGDKPAAFGAVGGSVVTPSPRGSGDMGRGDWRARQSCQALRAAAMLSATRIIRK